MDKTQVIDMKGLSVKAGYRYLLKDITWQVARGKHWLVFGMNGSGKTTLLSILAGYRQATVGHLSFFGESITADNLLTLRKRVGWVSSAFFDLKYTRESVLDIALSGTTGALGRDIVRDEDIKRAKVLFEELHIGDKLYQPFHMMSKGERENVLIARALLGEPEILLLDEPCTGLDVYAREHFLNTLRDLAQNSNLTIIYVTHYPEEILTDVFKQCLLLKNGTVYAQGDTAALFSSEIMSDFLGVPTRVLSRDGHGLEMQIETISHVSGILKVGDGNNDSKKCDEFVSRCTGGSGVSTNGC